MLVADGRHRYEYFVHRVCEAKAVWALFNDGWASVEGEGGETLIPFWPHRAYAEVFAQGAWVNFTPRRIALEEFLEQTLPGMRKVGAKPAVLPVPEGRSIVVELDDLEASLRHELSEVYGID